MAVKRVASAMDRGGGIVDWGGGFGGLVFFVAVSFVGGGVVWGGVVMGQQIEAEMYCRLLFGYQIYIYLDITFCPWQKSVIIQ